MQTICSFPRRGGMLFLVLLVLPLVTGCGSQKGIVSGKVTYQGKPLESGFVSFMGEKGAPVHADIHSDGTYRAENVPVGPVTITVQPKKSSLDASQASRMPRNAADFTKLKAAQSESGPYIPPKYADPKQSGLTYTVTKGTQQHDIDLK